MAIAGRAETDEQKREVVERLLRIWCKQPHLRLGQLLTNAVAHSNTVARMTARQKRGHLRALDLLPDRSELYDSISRAVRAIDEEDGIVQMFNVEDVQLAELVERLDWWMENDA